MRLDKYLKISRMIKRRTIAKEACDQGRIEVNGKVAKAGTVVKEGDEIKITFSGRSTLYKILLVKEHVTKEEALNMYQVLTDH